jgi:hypothetical protein
MKKVMGQQNCYNNSEKNRNSTQKLETCNCLKNYEIPIQRRQTLPCSSKHLSITGQLGSIQVTRDGRKFHVA